MEDFLKQPVVGGLGVSLILILVGAVAKKVISMETFSEKHFFLGVELALATFASTLTQAWDIVMGATPGTAVRSLGYTVVSILLFVFLMGLHQDWEAKIARRRARFFVLGVVANGIGTALLTAYVVYIKGR